MILQNPFKKALGTTAHELHSHLKPPCNLSTKFVINIILINAIQEFTNKENDKLQRIEMYSYLTMNLDGNMKIFPIHACVFIYIMQ